MSGALGGSPWATPSQQNGSYRPGKPLFDQRPNVVLRFSHREIMKECLSRLPRHPVVLAAMPWPVVPVHRLVPARVSVSHGSSVTAPSVRDYRIADGPLPGTGPLLTFQSPDWSVSALGGFGYPLSVCWFPGFRNTSTARQRRHHRLSSTVSQAPTTILEPPSSSASRLEALGPDVC